MLITLKADNPRAQIWYVTSATASPGDALRYRKPIRITESQPIYFFAYVDEQTESKIEKEEYIIVSSSGSSGSVAVSSGTASKAPSDIAAILKKPVQKPVAVKPTPKPIAVAGSGKILSGSIDTASGKTLSGVTTSAPPTQTATGEASATPKETIESLYKEQTPLEGSEIKKLLQNSKSS